MSEDTNNVAPVETQEQAPEKQYSAIEQRAMEQGWRPKEEFQGDPEAFIDAPEFVRRGELFSKIEVTTRELKQVRQALDALKDHHSKVKETEYKRALASLEAARKQALVEGEHERFFALEEKIEEIKTEKQTFDEELQQASAPAQEVHPAFADWLSKNKWYETDEAMRAYADRLGTKYAKTLSPPEALRQITEDVKKKFAHEFTNPKSSRPMAVEPSGRGASNAGNYTMSPEERDIMRKFVRSGVMTEAQYIAELKKVNGVK